LRTLHEQFPVVEINSPFLGCLTDHAQMTQRVEVRKLNEDGVLPFEQTASAFRAAMQRGVVAKFRLSLDPADSGIEDADLRLCHRHRLVPY
jgi:hypothetical protein